MAIVDRVHSIAHDARFVDHVHAHYPLLPLLPNLRCGPWYVDPAIAAPEHAYFKSTDGHTNNWSFNLRRPNLHLLPLIAQHAGLVLVDSTRAGKRIPDALSKTVPIWCAVLNRAVLARGASPWDTALYTPPGSVSPQEHSQIEDRLDAWAAQLAASSYSLPALDRPLRPIWITPATTVFPSFPDPPDRAFYPIICVSASTQVPDGVERCAEGFSYIQGAGDDHELWGMGLTPALYWSRRDDILSARPDDLPDLVRSLVSAASRDDAAANQPACGAPIQRVSGRIAITTLAALGPSLLQTHPDVAFLCLTPQHPSHLAPIAAPDPTRLLAVHTPEGKKGQRRFLAAALPRGMPFVRRHLERGRVVCIACPTGTDASVGVAVAALATFFRSDGTLCTRDAREDVSKDALKTRLQWIIASCPRANPSRATLKRVNDFLLSPFADLSALDVDERDEDDQETI